jgi:hypothetical protein
MNDLKTFRARFIITYCTSNYPCKAGELDKMRVIVRKYIKGVVELCGGNIVDTSFHVPCEKAEDPSVSVFEVFPIEFHFLHQSAIPNLKRLLLALNQYLTGLSLFLDCVFEPYPYKVCL